MEDICVREGMNRFSFHAFVSWSPVIVQLGHSVYGLVGGEVSEAQIDELLAARRANRTARRVLDSHGWTDSGKVWLSYRLSKAASTYAVITVPAALKKVVRGRFALVTPDGRRIGALATKDGRAWGLGAFLRQHGARIDDRILLTLDLNERTATVSWAEEEGGESTLGCVRMPNNRGWIIRGWISADVRSRKRARRRQSHLEGQSEQCDREPAERWHCCPARYGAPFTCTCPMLESLEARSRCGITVRGCLTAEGPRSSSARAFPGSQRNSERCLAGDEASSSRPRAVIIDIRWSSTACSSAADSTAVNDLTVRARGESCIDRVARREGSFNSETGSDRSARKSYETASRRRSMARFPPLAGLRRGLRLHLADKLRALDHRQSRAALSRRLRHVRLQPRLPPQPAKRRTPAKGTSIAKSSSKSPSTSRP